MKNARQEKILELISKNPIDKQDELLSLLKADGFEVTQATVSRDIRELRLVKTASEKGYRYVSSLNSNKLTHTSSKFENIFRESVLGVDYAGHTVLVKCYTGMANAACEVFDAMHWDNVVGTLSGDGTFLVLMRTEEDAQDICQQLKKYIKN